MSSPAFLEPAWFESINRRLALVQMDSELASQRMNAKVVFEFSDAPRHVAHAMTFTLDESGARLAALDDLGADLVVALAYLDAVEIESGKLTSSQALREGRLKVRGDVNALITFSAWMAAAHEALSQQSE